VNKIGWCYGSLHQEGRREEEGKLWVGGLVGWKLRVVVEGREKYNAMSSRMRQAETSRDKQSGGVEGWRVMRE
jgi:predicted secreted protein